MNYVIITYACSILFLLPGCMMGPNHKKPVVNIPTNYAEQHQDLPTENLATWWQSFEDPCLNQLIEQAMRSNYTLRIAIERIEEARDIYRIVFSRMFPEIDVTLSVSHERFPRQLVPFQGAPTDLFTFYQAGIIGFWEIDFWGKLRRAAYAAYHDYNAQIEQMRTILIVLLADVARTYIDIRTLEQQKMLSEKLVVANEELLRLYEDLQQAGLASEIPYQQQQEELKRSQNELLELQTLHQQALYSLAVLLGETPEDFKLCSAPGGVPQAKNRLTTGLPSELLRRRPDIREAEERLAAATDRVGQAMAEWFPSFNLLGAVGTEALTSCAWFSHGSLAWSIGPSITWPIITFGRIKYNVKAKESVERQASLAYARSIVEALAEVETFLVAYFNRQQQVQHTEEKALAAQRKRDLIAELFHAGLESKLTLLIAEKNSIAMMLELTQEQQRLSTALIGVYKAVGGGW